MNVWTNPLSDQAEEADVSMDAYLKQFLTKQKQLSDFTRFAWDISPELAVHLPSRFRALPTVRFTVQELVRTYPEAVSHVSEALPLFLGDSPMAFDMLDSQKLSQIVLWQHCSPVVALSMLCPDLYHAHVSYTRLRCDLLRVQDR